VPTHPQNSKISWELKKFGPIGTPHCPRWGTPFSPRSPRRTFRFQPKHCWLATCQRRSISSSWSYVAEPHNLIPFQEYSSFIRHEVPQGSALNYAIPSSTPKGRTQKSIFLHHDHKWESKVYNIFVIFTSLLVQYQSNSLFYYNSGI
jgi:hypothetical protein